MSDDPRGRGPLAGKEPAVGPIDDPTLADRTNPRWADPTAPEPHAQPMAHPDGTPNVLPPRSMEGSHVVPPMAGLDDPEDQAAQWLEGRAEPGTDNIREGRGGGAPNPALAEGGEEGDG